MSDLLLASILAPSADSKKPAAVSRDGLAQTKLVAGAATTENWLFRYRCEAPIRAQENRADDCAKIDDVGANRKASWLSGVAAWLYEMVEETLTCHAVPDEHRRRIRANIPLQRIMREIRWRTPVVGAFPGSKSAIHLAAARWRHIAGTKWSNGRDGDSGATVGDAAAVEL